MAPVIVGSALAAHDHRFVLAASILCLGFALLVQIATNFANDYYDFVHGADNADRVGPRRAVASGLVTPEQMRRAMITVFSAAFFLGLALIHWGGPWMLVVGIASIACGVAYTGGPWPLGYHGFGDVFVFLFFGVVAVNVTYFVQAGRISAGGLLSGAAVGALATNILLVNNYRDAETDKAAGKRTLVVRFGQRFARAQFVAALGIAAAAPMLLVWRGYAAWCLLPLLLAPVALSHARRLRRGRTPAEHIALLGATGRLLAAYAVLFAVGVLI